MTNPQVYLIALKVLQTKFGGPQGSIKVFGNDSFHLLDKIQQGGLLDH